ncbi:alpha/beta fold hydrolase [Microbacterium sp.]|uniref:alpha/beta fold hydrolase n=1 Tax=Microbacterium sp. TaxID=51671 RepID=UPI0039E43F7C
MPRPEIALTAPAGPAGAPVVVLAHSLGTGPLIWERVVPVLAVRYRVSLLTLPGHGEAPVPGAPFTMAELADAVARAAPVASGLRYAGVSIGGALGLELALRHPELVAAVASVASAASLGTPDLWRERARFVRERSTSALVTESAARWFAPASIGRDPAMVGRVLHALQDTSDEGYARCAEALATYDVRARLGELRTPVLAMGGCLDEVAPEERQDELVAGVPGARKLMIEAAAHQPPAEQPAAVAAALRAFFEEVAP